MNNYKLGVHDPTIIQVENTYFLFSTDTTQPLTSGIPIRSSLDLINWEFEKQALERVPQNAKNWSNSEILWAPDIVKVKDQYRMYYSSSTFGSSKSFIGLAVANHPLGNWEDKGEVIKSSPELTDCNAIDANICEDNTGQQWMVYGSFFGGIYIISIDKNTGKPKHDGYGKKIAQRPKSVDKAIEGPFITYNEKHEYFYLFVSYDSLNDFYNIRVGRSKNIDGPYKDFNGNDLLNNDININPDIVGTKILGGYEFEGEPPVYAPGHNSVFKDLNNNHNFLVHHARLKPHSDQFFVQIRTLFWLDNGWPAVSPYESSHVVKVSNNDNYLKNKKWEIVIFDEMYVKHSKIIDDMNKFLDEMAGYYVLYKENNTYYITGMNKVGISYFGKIKN